VQKDSFGNAYKPGLDRMRSFDALLGHPSGQFKSIHVAGTNGKGSVCNMLCAALCRCGYKTALYTSPHIEDFRERMRINGKMPPKEYVYGFITEYKEDFERLGLSFFEITTGMAFRWFADNKVDAAVIEVGLGGRLDSTNIITPELSVVTSIGLDHTQYLGNTLSEVAGEKAGIFKAGSPAVVGEVLPETERVFSEKASSLGIPLTVASQSEPPLWEKKDAILEKMDLKGPCQEANLRTVLCCTDLLKGTFPNLNDSEKVLSGIENTASDMDFHGRWEKIWPSPLTLCDIGHNAPALKGNFSRLSDMLSKGECSSLTILYGIMADKDLDAILPLMPKEARWVFCSPETRRALPSADLYSKCLSYWEKEGLPTENLFDGGGVENALRLSFEKAMEDKDSPLVYVGGSTFVVSEASKILSSTKKDT